MGKMREHHIGIVVRDMEESRWVFSCLGYHPCTEVTEDIYQHNKILFLEDGQDSNRIELIEPLDEASTVRNVRPGMHHICYEVEDSFLDEFKAMKIGKIFSSIYIAPALEGRKVMFACLRGGMFVEFLEKELDCRE